MGESDVWNNLPTDLLIKIFRLLPLKNLGRCSQVCSNWNRVFYLDDVWKTFTFHDYTFVRRRFTQHAGWQYTLDHMRLRFCIPMIIEKWREIEVQPISNLFNLYEFLQKITNFSEFQERWTEFSPLGRVKKFSFKWSLHVQDRNSGGETEEKDIGTGGEMLRSIRALLFQLHSLKNLELHQLQLNSNDTVLLLNELVELFQEQLVRLVMPNLSLFPNSALHLGLFLNLRHLSLSPTSLSDSSIVLLGDLNHLRSLHIIQDERSVNIVSCSPSAWKTFRRSNRGKTRITLILRGKPKVSLLLQPSAPVTAIRFERSAGQVSFELAEKICSEYSGTLETFEEGGLERMKRSNLVIKRGDRAVLDIATRCHKLKILCIRERIALGTAILLSLQAKENGFRLFLRKNGLLKRTSWKRTEVDQMGVSFDWLRELSRDYDLAEEEISRLSGPLTILSDKRYKDFFK